MGVLSKDGSDKAKPNFAGWATRAGLKCSDGRTIQPNAFQHQDGARVPLVWQHGHSDPENVLGHAILENRSEGVYAYAFFNKTPKAEHARELVEHEDIKSLSIWANQLIEQGGNVLHGAIREVSLVLSGANPGAMIEHITLSHGDGEQYELDDEAIISTGLPLEHADTHIIDDEKEEDMKHADGDETVQDVYDSMSDKQKQVLHFMVGEALASAGGDGMGQSDLEDLNIDDPDVKAVYTSMNDEQREVLHQLVDRALKHVDDDDDDKTDDDKTDDEDSDQEGKAMKHNVFEDQGDGKSSSVLSHDDMKGIVADATRAGSLRTAVENYALAHNITDIENLFPEAQLVGGGAPEIDSRRMEWVASILGSGGVRKSPFSRIKTTAADVTMEEARAKGYIKGTLKKEEFFSVSTRSTTPTTIYKKQKLDRDDVVDITDFDVVVWLKQEMRLMLDEELARAILVGDGRDVASDDKINEGNIRPVVGDHELFVTTVNVNLADASSSISELVDAVVMNRRFYKGSGTPNFYTTETVIGQFLTLRDSMGRRIYGTLADVAAELRVKEIVPVEILEEYPDLAGVMFNPADYTVGADKGGEVNFFDDFDIDYNQQKYLIETRCSGALTKLKAAIVFNKVAAATVLLDPEEPDYNDETGVVTIPTQTGVTYKNADGDATIPAGAMAALDDGESISIYAVASAGYAFNTSANDSWTFTK